MEIYILLLIIVAFLLFIKSRILAKGPVAIVVFGIFKPRISFGSTFYIPILEQYRTINLGLNTLSVCGRGQESLRCKDYIKVEIECFLYYQIRRDLHSIMSFFDKNNGYLPIDPKSIYESACKEKLSAVVADFDFEDLFRERDNFRNQILESVITLFPEIEIVDLTIDFVEQLALSKMDPEDELDRKGIKKIEAMLAEQKTRES